MSRQNQPRYQRDYQIVEALGGTPSVQFLRKDRMSEQRIPYHRVGKLCLYNLDEVIAAIEGLRVGGGHKNTKRAKA